MSSSTDSTADDALRNQSELMRFEQIPLESVLINEKVGSGQFGDVFHAMYRKPNSGLVEVAIKKLKITEDDGSYINVSEKQLITQRFIREASKQ